jgi:hypothetical protein
VERAESEAIVAACRGKTGIASEEQSPYPAFAAAYGLTSLQRGAKAARLPGALTCRCPDSTNATRFLLIRVRTPAHCPGLRRHGQENS